MQHAWVNLPGFSYTKNALCKEVLWHFDSELHDEPDRPKCKACERIVERGKGAR